MSLSNPKGRQVISENNVPDKSKTKNFSKSDSILPHKDNAINNDRICAYDIKQHHEEPAYRVAQDSIVPNRTQTIPSNSRSTNPSRQTYSAQHHVPHLTKPNSNMLPQKQTATTGCEALYNVSSNGTGKIQNVSKNCSTTLPPSTCPCSNPPPPPPCASKDDLWDLQFCRWWGWNWVRKREELLNKQKMGKKSKEKCNPDPSCCENPPPCKPCKRRRKYFSSWCSKLLKKGRRCKKKHLKEDEKDRLQRLYDTPCSSVTFNQCPCPMNEWDCRSINLEGEYECCYNGTRQTSRSTIFVQNQTRRKACKYNVRKHQSWVCDKMESSSSDECRPCISTSRRACNSSTEESVEYLSMRMECITSDCEADGCQWRRCCQKNCCGEKKDNCCSSPCRPKRTNCRKPNNCCQKPARCPQKMKILPCKNVPACRCCTPPRIPRFRKRSPPCVYVTPECQQPPKRKIAPCCCYCQQPCKKIKTNEKCKKVYVCCCCCCGCCRSSEKSKGNSNSKSKSGKADLKKTVDKGVGVAFMSMPNPGQMIEPNNQDPNDIFNPLPYGGLLNKLLYNKDPFSVTKSLVTGLYASPISGRKYSLNPKLLTPAPVSSPTQLPKPIDINDANFLFNITPAQSPCVDEEHKALLNAVCEAIMSSQCSIKDNCTSSKKTFLNKDCTNDYSRLLPSEQSTELMVHGYESSDTQDTQKTESHFSTNAAGLEQIKNDSKRKTRIPVKRSRFAENKEQNTSNHHEVSSSVKQSRTLSPVQEEKLSRNSDFNHFNGKLTSGETLTNFGSKSSCLTSDGLNTASVIDEESNLPSSSSPRFSTDHCPVTNLLSRTSDFWKRKLSTIDIPVVQHYTEKEKLKRQEFCNRLLVPDVLDGFWPSFTYNMNPLSPSPFIMQGRARVVEEKSNSLREPFRIELLTDSPILSSRQTITESKETGTEDLVNGKSVSQNTSFISPKTYGNRPNYTNIPDLVSLNDPERFISLTDRISEDHVTDLHFLKSNAWNCSSTSETSSVNSLLKEQSNKYLELSTISEEKQILTPKSTPTTSTTAQNTFISTTAIPFKMHYSTVRNIDKENFEYPTSKVRRKESPFSGSTSYPTKKSLIAKSEKFKMKNKKR